MTIDIPFALKETVQILPLDRTGVVIAIWIGDVGIQYKVRYFADMDAKEVYFFAEEIARMKEENRAGFSTHFIDEFPS